MDLERERGITIKAHPVTMRYTSKSGETYRLNLLDTPGHVDFAYEVSRQPRGMRGSLANRGRGAGRRGAKRWRTSISLTNRGFTIVPIINKIDLPNARTSPSVKRPVGRNTGHPR